MVMGFDTAVAPKYELMMLSLMLYPGVRDLDLGAENIQLFPHAVVGTYQTAAIKFMPVYRLGAVTAAV